MALNISPTPNVPTGPGVSQGIDPSFMGFAVECTSFFDYAGTKDSRNKFSQNLMSAFHEKTGSPTYVRVGGTSMDHTKFDPHATKAVDFPNGHGDHLHSNITLGKPWLDSFSAFDNVKYTIHVPLARQHIENTSDFAKACIQAMGGEMKLDSIEIGNEPNLYPNRDRGPNYGPGDYVNEFKRYANAVKDKTDIGNGKKFQVLTYAFSGGNRGKFTAEAAFGPGGIDKEKWVKSASEHYYQVSIQGKPPSIQDTIMNHLSTKNIMRTFLSDINWLADNHGNVEFVLGEVGVALGGEGPPPYDFSATFGAALWTVDFALHAMTIGIKRVNMQMGTNFAFSAWQPITTDARKQRTNAGFYGQIFVADFIGKDNGLRVAELDIDKAHPHIVAYGAWSSGKLSKVVVINLNVWNKGEGDRGRTAFTIDHLGNHKTAKVEHLASPGGAKEQSDITFGGFEWTAENQGKPKKKLDNTKTININGGKINSSVDATEALLITLN